MELFYLLLFFLNDDALKQSQSPVVDDLIEHRKYISEKITLFENAEENKTIGGNIDGEGTLRIPICIFKNGVNKNIISRFSVSEHEKNSASAYRFDYSTLSHTKASKVFIKPGNVTEEQILLSGDLIGKVETFQGMFESFNKDTFNFSALLQIALIKGGKSIGIETKRVHLNIINILSNVTAVTDNINYSGDGSFLVPSMLCEFKDNSLS